jgi:hypothetical protein
MTLLGTVTPWKCKRQLGSSEGAVAGILQAEIRAKYDYSNAVKGTLDNYAGILNLVRCIKSIRQGIASYIPKVGHASKTVNREIATSYMVPLKQTPFPIPHTTRFSRVISTRYLIQAPTESFQQT